MFCKATIKNLAYLSDQKTSFVAVDREKCSYTIKLQLNLHGLLPDVNGPETRFTSL